MNRLVAYAKLARPAQWSKNTFVLAPVIFSGQIGPIFLARALGAFACFCLLSSAVYIFNDIIDAPQDRKHPRKRSRPLAAGTVSVFEAAVLIVGLLALFAGVVVFLPLGVAIAAACYLGNSLLYCLWLKYRVIIDVIMIAVGFEIRLIAGCLAIAVEPSSWLLLCGFSLALLLGFGKRRTEIEHLGEQFQTRLTLRSYSPAKLDVLLAVAASVCLLTYALYTTSPDTVSLHGTSRLIFTLPLVFYGIFRYVFKVQDGRGDGPTDILLTDKIFWATGVLWVSSVLIILYVIPK